MENIVNILYRKHERLKKIKWEIYWKCDILLLGDKFEIFRTESIIVFELDLVYYLSTPSYNLDVMLRFTHVSINSLKPWSGGDGDRGGWGGE